VRANREKEAMKISA